nr:Chain B, LIM Kinase 1 peptide [Homo sapiens]
RKKRYTVVGN